MNLYQDTDKFSVEKYGSHEEWLKKRGRGISVGHDVQPVSERV